MEKCKIFIASSTRTLTLAEMLRDELKTDFCEATLWSQESKGKPSATIIEMLEKAGAKYDFAVIILSQDDVLTKDSGDELKARDNCVFEAGLFMAALGRDRCFLVNSVEQKHLPTDVGGIISIPFTEPEAAKLADRETCGDAIRDASSRVKNAVQKAGRSPRRLLTQAELLAREQLKDPQGRGPGYLEPDQVVVTAVQPAELNYAAAMRVRTNIDHGVSYIYYFQGGTDPANAADGAQKTCRLLQLLLLAPLLDAKQADDYMYLQTEVSNSDNQSKILQVLQEICESGSLRIHFLPAAPKLQYCIHNAASNYAAVLYFKCGDVKRSDDGKSDEDAPVWMEWATAGKAYEFWAEVRQRQAMTSGAPNAIFRGAYGLNVKDDVFYNAVKTEMRKYFRGIAEQVTKLCFEGTV